MKNSMPNSARTRRDCGQVLVLFVLLMVVLILFVGLGIDLGFSYITRAELSKSVDAAALMGAKSLSQGRDAAEAVAYSTFDLNYGVSSRDAEAPHVDVQPFTDANNNEVVHVTATVNINTFFIRVLPHWSTLAVAADAEATRANVIMTLVLDTSGSMDPSRGPGGTGTGSGGGQYLPGAVTTFINNFDDTHDQAAVVSFATIPKNIFFGGSPARPQPTQPFRNAIVTDVNAFTWDGYTFSQGGLANALVIENNATIPVNESVVKVVVFCTDGLANIIQGTFDCPPSTILNFGGKDSCDGGPGVNFCDSITGKLLCSNVVDGAVPPCCPGATNGFFSAATGIMEPFACTDVTAEARFRAVQVARQMRDAGIIVYSIGVGTGIDLNFLQQVANDPALAGTLGYRPTQRDGQAVVANDVSQLGIVFQQIADKILFRLTK